MTLEEKVGKTLAELGVTDAQGVVSLFAEVRAAMDAEREKLKRRGAVDEAERTKFAKEVRGVSLGFKTEDLSRFSWRTLREVLSGRFSFIGHCEKMIPIYTTPYFFSFRFNVDKDMPTARAARL